MQPSYFSSRPGKLCTLAGGIELAAFGLDGMLGDPGLSLRLFVILSSIAICVMIFAVAMGAETHPGATILAILVIPFVLWTFYPGAKALVPDSAMMGTALVGLGIVGIILGLIPPKKRTS